MIISFIGIFVMYAAHDDGFVPALKWLFSAFLISFLLRPLLCLKNLKLFDGGFSLSFCLGLAIAFMVSFFPSSLGLIRFDTFTVYLGLLIPALACNILLWYRKRHLPEKSGPDFRWSEENVSRFLFGFALFILLFAIAFYIRGFKGNIGEQTEQFMDFGFMQTIFRQKQLPPEDLWYSGKTLNYYYLGQACGVYLCRLSFITPEYGYNFMLCTVFTAVFMTVFTTTESVCAYLRGTKRIHSFAGGFIASVFAVLGANGHYYIYGLLYPLIGKKDKGNYWFSDPTAFIGHFEGSTDLGKHEFPAYTVILGDLHAHVCNMLFTIPLIAILLDYALYMGSPEAGDRTAIEVVKGRTVREGAEDRTDKEGGDGNLLTGIFGFVKNNRQEYYSSYILLIALLLGLYRGTNYWDFPIYFVISGAVILFTDLKYHGVNRITVLSVLLKGFIILILGTILMIPFNMHFEKMSSDIGFCDRHSPFLQFMTVWWPFILFMIVLLFSLLGKKADIKSPEERNDDSGSPEERNDDSGSYEERNDDSGSPETGKSLWTRLFGRAASRIGNLTYIELALAALILCAFGLLIGPEIIYIKDIYGYSYQRYNTMFKLTFQAFILFSILSGISVTVFLKKKGFLKIYAIFVIVMGLLSGTYIFKAVNQWIGPVYSVAIREGISAYDFLRAGISDYGKEWGAIQRLNSDEREHIHIVECAGESYSPDSKLSVFTGACTVVGWRVHEWMWQNNEYYVRERGDEVRLFYESGDREFCRDFLDRYDIDYIYVGPRERQKYNINTEGFMEFAQGIWNDENGEAMLITVAKP